MGEPSGAFCDVGCCCCFFTSLKAFTFAGYFSLPPAFHSDFPGPWSPPPALSSTLATFACFTFARYFYHSFTANATVLSGLFYPQAFFVLHNFLTFWCVLWLRYRQEHLIQDLSLCLTLQRCPFRLTRGLEPLILSIAPVSHEL